MTSLNHYNNKGLISTKSLYEIAEKVVNHFIGKRVIPFADRKDFIQSVVEKYYTKRDRIENGYSGKAKISTYVTSVIYKMTCEEIRSEIKHWKQQKEDANLMLEMKKDNSLSPEQELIISNEKILLQKAFLTLGKESAKAKLFLKCYYRLPVSENELKEYAQDKHQVDLMKKIKQNPMDKDKDVYEKLAVLLEMIEEKMVQVDAVRMYVNKMVNRIINRLNGRNQRSSYTKETLGYLMELAL